MKKCNMCHEALPLDSFHNRSASKDGKAHRCKQCVKTYDSGRYSANPEYFAERFQNWIANNRDKKAAIDKAWKQSEKGKDSIRSHTHRRRTLTRTGETVAMTDFVALYGDTCLYPGCDRKDIQMDHVVPLSLGGVHSLSNLQPLCAYHNNTKGNRNSNDYRGVTI